MLALALALLTTVAIAPGAQRADAATVRSFGKLFSQQTNGSIVITGNRLLTCSASTACTQALSGASSSSNNNFAMSFLDVDAVSTTTSSSSASVTVPAGGRVIYAGLFWGAARAAGSGGSAASGNANQLKFRTPAAGTYSTLTADSIDSSGLSTNDYSAYKDVTALVQTGGSGAYWSADISAATGTDRYASWSMVVAIADPAAPLRDLTVFNGYATLTSNETVTANISGFLTPPSGTVNAKFGTIAYEGDASITGDYMTVGSTRLADAENPSANFFGSRVTAAGANLLDRNPNSLNNFGGDAKVVDAPGVVPNGATSATVTFSTAGDFYYPAALTTQIDLYAPTITGTKTVSDLNGNSPAKVGDTLEYTMSFTNSGNDNAATSIIEDALPANTTYVPGSLQVLAGANTGVKTDTAGDDQAEYVAANRLVRYRVGTGANAAVGGTLTNGATTRVRFQVTLNAASAGTSVTNSANLLYTAATIGTRYTYQTSDVATVVASLADLSLVKTGTPASTTAGSNVTYTLVTTNAGPTAAADVVLTDTLPTGSTLVSTNPTQGTCKATGQTVSCALGALANASSATVTIVVRVAPEATTTGITNVADVTSATSDPNTTNNRASVTTSVTRAADVSLTKTAAPTTPVPGSTVTYTLTATNNGASTATGVVVTDDLPVAFSGLTATNSAGACSVTGNGVSCPVGALAPGASAIVRITGTLDPAFIGGSLSNAGQVQADTPDPVSTNNTASAVITPAAAQSDVRVAKETLTTPVVAGAPVQYRITVSNAGPSLARDVSLSDTLAPASYSAVTATTTAGTCSITSGAVACTIGALPSGSSASVVVNATVRSTVQGTLTNTATATTTTTDPSTANNTASVSDTVTSRADLVLSKTASPTPVVDGEVATYTITVRNSGPSVSRGVVVTDPVPSPLTYVSSASSHGSCAEVGGTVTCSLGDLTVGTTATVTVVARVPSAGGANGVTNTAGVTSTTTDPEPGNNTASYRLQTGASANIVMTKTASTRMVTAGQQVTFLLTARNTGPSDATTVTISDTLPASLTGITASTSTVGAGCAVAGQTVTCTVPSLANGAGLAATVTATVAASTPAGTLSNTATASAATPDDPTAADNTATSVTTVQTRADLAVVKEGPATVVAGATLTWTLTASNAGPSVADTVVVDDALPAGVSFVSGTGATCSQQQSLSSSLVTCAVGSLAVGASRVITLVGRVDADTPEGTVLSNRATVASATTDPAEANNTATHVTSVRTAADVSVTKSVSPSPLIAGSPATYTLVARNTGPSTARDVRVTDTLPSGVTVASAAFAGGSCTVTGQTVTCTRSALASGATADVVLRVAVDPAQTANVVNTASVATTSSDPAPDNDTTTITTPVVNLADLEVVKSVDQRDVVAGTGLTYTLTVINNGPSVATGVTLHDALPTGLTYRESTATSGSCSVDGQDLSCALGSVSPGDPVTVTLTARLARGYGSSSVTNTATVTSAVTDPVASNNSGTATSTVTRSAEVSLVKSASSDTLVPGTAVTYTLAVTNQGPSTAQTVVVTDTVPADITISTATWGPAATPCEVTGQDVQCALGAVNVGQVAVTITGTLGALFTDTTVTNTGVLTTTTDDPTTGDHRSTLVSPVVGQADLALVKTMTPANPVAGQQVTFTLTATNNGPSLARNPQFIDQLPAGLTDVSVVPPPGATGCDIIPPVDPGTADNPNAPTVTCSGPIFRAGFTVAGTITATVSPGFTGVLSNTGRTSSDTIDPVASNNESIVSATVRQSADVSITKSISPARPVPGGLVSFALIVRNAGPSTATSVTVSDEIPSVLSGVTATTAGGTCSLVSASLVCPVGTVDPGEDITVTVEGTLRPDFTGTLSNTATVSTATPDPEGSNNTATASGVSSASADLSIVKTLSPTAPVPGEPVRFTLAVRNDGPSTATGVTVSDDLATAVTGASATSTAGSCSVNAGNALTCALGSLAPSGTVSVSVVGTLAPAFTGVLTNLARVSSPVADPDSSNNTSSVSGSSAPSADLSISKTISPSAPLPGSAVAFTIAVRNAGPSAASGVVVSDQISSAISQLTATTDNGTTCTVSDSNTMACPLGSVGPAATATVSVTGTLSPAFTGTLSNTASVTATTRDSNADNNSATASGTAAPSADLSISKTLAPAVPVPGEQVRFTLVARNAGPSTAAAVVLTDPLDPALLSPSATTTAGACTIASSTLSCPVGSVGPDGSVTVTVTATLSADFTGRLANTASVASPTADPATDNNSATVTGDGAPSADVSILKTLSPPRPVPGQQVTFTLSVTNAGPSSAAEVVARDQLSAALSGVTATSTRGTCTVSVSNELDCALGLLAPSAVATVTVTATLDAASHGAPVEHCDGELDDGGPPDGKQHGDRQRHPPRLGGRVGDQDDEPDRPGPRAAGRLLHHGAQQRPVSGDRRDGVRPHRPLDLLAHGQHHRRGLLGQRGQRPDLFPGRAGSRSDHDDLGRRHPLGHVHRHPAQHRDRRVGHTRP